MNKITVAGQIVMPQNITLFLADGTSKVLPSDAWRTQSILDAIMPTLAKNEHPTIDLDEFSIAKAVERMSDKHLQVQGDDIKLAGADASALKPHIEQAVYGQDAKGFKKFMMHLDEMIQKRRYVVNELLEHMKHGDLPIADDGSLIGYKVLAKDAREGYMVDKHTKQVVQRLGSLVYMPESKVDQSRQLCSTGLHIASRKYLGGFWGGEKDDRICLVKINPKNVVSVPAGEASKMRVSAYQIVGIFRDDDAKRIANGAKIEELPKAFDLLANVKAGNHPPIVEVVEVTGMGNVQVKLVEKVKERKVRPVRALGKKVELSVKALKSKFKKLKAGLSRDDAYAKKLAKAQKLYDQGWSIREIAPHLNMDRESLGKNLKRQPGR